MYTDLVLVAHNDPTWSSVTKICRLCVSFNPNIDTDLVFKFIDSDKEEQLIRSDITSDLNFSNITVYKLKYEL